MVKTVDFLTKYCSGCGKVLGINNRSMLCHKCWQTRFDKMHKGVGKR